MTGKEPNAVQPLIELIERFLNGTATASDHEQLADRLRRSPEARRFYLHYMNLHSALRRRFAFEAEATAGDTVAPPTARSTRPRRVLRPVGWAPYVGVAVVTLLLAVGVLFVLSGHTAPLATIVKARGAVQWTGDGGRVVTRLEPGTVLGGGTLEVLAADSWATLALNEGSTVTLLGCTTLTIAADHGIEIRLGEGRLSATVAKQAGGRPMIVHTPTARLEVLGTQFEIDAEKATTTLRVNEGCVRVTRLADGRVADVQADHQVVVPASRAGELKVVPCPKPVHLWQSNLPCRATYGQWVSAGPAGPARLEAAPILLDYSGRPATVHLAAGSVGHGPAPPIVLVAGARLRICLCITTPADVYFGLSAKYLKGGFAGKYIAHRRFAPEQVSGRPTTIELHAEDFGPQEKEFPTSPVGLEIVDWWCFTYNVDAGLGIVGVELLPPGASPASPAPTSESPSPIADLWTAASQGNLEAIKRHLAAGADINARFVAPGIPASGATPLHLAVLADQREVARYLAECGADLNARARDEHGGTPLHWAAALGRLEMARILIEAGADVNARDIHGFTPLDATQYDRHASAESRKCVAELLRRHGALSGSNRPVEEHPREEGEGP